MKVIVNSRMLYNQITKAIRDECDFIEITDDLLRFKNSKNNLKYDIVLHSESKANLADNLNLLKWYKISLFLKEIQEQPITMNFSGSQIEIYCVKYF